MIVSIGSINKAKIKAVERTYRDLGIEVTLLPIDSPSGVSSMPFSDEETMNGAANRAEYCLRGQKADIAIGLEGGVMETSSGLFLCNWGALAEEGKETLLAGGARIKLPEAIAERLRIGEELGPVMDDYSKRQGVSTREGAVGVFTNGLVDRTEMFSHIIRLLIGQRENRRDSSG